ncbi:hypothetical protein PMIN03_003698 [Paraphaeosphaeria minitans]
MECHRPLIPLKLPTDRTHGNLSTTPTSSRSAHTLLIFPIRILQLRKKPQLPPLHPPLVIQILIILPNIPLMSEATRASPSSPPNPILRIPPQIRSNPASCFLPSQTVVLADKLLHAPYAPISEPDLDAPGMVAAREEVGDDAGDLATRGLVDFEDE